MEAKTNEKGKTFIRKDEEKRENDKEVKVGRKQKKYFFTDAEKLFSSFLIFCFENKVLLKKFELAVNGFAGTKVRKCEEVVCIKSKFTLSELLLLFPFCSA